MIIPALLENDFETIKTKIELLKNNAPLIQVDICDGEFAGELTFTEIEKLGQLNSQIDLHLMVKDPMRFLKTKVETVKSLGVHVESEVTISEFIQKATKLEYEVGICLNPETEIEAILPYIEAVKYVQFLTVTPGAQGQNFKPEVLEKIEHFKLRHPQIGVQVDGGVSMENLEDIIEIKVDNIVIGSKIFGGEDPLKNYLGFCEKERELRNE